VPTPRPMVLATLPTPSKRSRLAGYTPGEICSQTSAKSKNYDLVAAFAINASIALPQSLLN
jgi:hypothetical protein